MSWPSRRTIRAVAATGLLACVLVLSASYAATGQPAPVGTPSPQATPGPIPTGPDDAERPGSHTTPTDTDTTDTDTTDTDTTPTDTTDTDTTPTDTTDTDTTPTDTTDASDPGRDGSDAWGGGIDGIVRDDETGGDEKYGDPGPGPSSDTVRTADSVTVVSTQGFYVSDETAELIAFDEDGNVLYYDATYRAYFDVDPVPGRRYTVEYVAAQHYTGVRCHPVESNVCTRNVVERVNLSTGETTRVYAELTPRVYSARWHDTDRIDATHVAIADIVHDRVSVVDTRSGEITWQWNASERFGPEQGGHPGDWTHLNDVEVLEDGRVLVSVRNMDQVVFVDPGAGVIEGWTLGAEDDHGTLYEQHNPDYIPASRGGPAVLVSDSENNRIVEYGRQNGSWVRTWAWRDARLQWPRDADRLPNGHTLVVDSHGDRVLELDDSGRVVWNVTVGLPYDAERLETGDESTGPAWTAMNHGADGGASTVDGPFHSPSDRAVLFAKGLVPSIVVNGLLYVSPSGIRFVDLLFAAGLVVDLVAWGAFELYWSERSVRGVLGGLHSNT